MRRWAPFSVLAVLALIALVGVGAFFFLGKDDSVSHLVMAPGDSSRTAGSDGDSAGSRRWFLQENRLPWTTTRRMIQLANPSRPARAARDHRPNQRPGCNRASVNSRRNNRGKGRSPSSEFAAARGLKLKDGKVQVVLEVASASAAATQAAIAAGAIIETTHDGLIQAEVPVESLPQLAASSSISYIREPRRPTTFVTSEGVADIGADTWQSAGNNGAGVKVAVLDPGFSGYSQLVASGELPANVITRSYVAGGDITGGGEKHGAACAEIVYDTAPGAQLYLVNFSTDVELGNAVDYLISQGVNVVSASWGFYGSFRGDGQGSIDDIVQRANAA